VRGRVSRPDLASHHATSLPPGMPPREKTDTLTSFAPPSRANPRRVSVSAICFAMPYQTDKGAGGVFLRADGSWLTIRADADIQPLRYLFEIADGHTVDSHGLPSIPTPGDSPPALPVLELQLGKATPTARLILEPVQK